VYIIHPSIHLSIPSFSMPPKRKTSSKKRRGGKNRNKSNNSNGGAASATSKSTETTDTSSKQASAATDTATNSNKLPAVRVSHLDWTVTVDFDAQVLWAVATYTLAAAADNAPLQQLELDTNHLTIEQVVDIDNEPLPYQLLPATPGKPHLGRKLVIDLLQQQQSSNGDSAATTTPTTKISVSYQTTAASSALQWLTAAQTAGKQYPYVFTQCQAIHARSLVPCQDVTGVKFTYTAAVTVPAWATVVLSGVPQSVVTTNVSNDDDDDDDSHTQTAVWHQVVPISSYLLALAAGQLERRELSERCAVYSEPSVVDAAAREFADTEKFLATAEDIAGTPYPWNGRYDLLCLPPSVRGLLLLLLE